MNPEFAYEGPRPRRGVQWGAIGAGALAGFGILIILGALGAAIGMTAGAALSDEPVDPGETAVGFGLGAGLWAILCAAASGLVGGWVYCQSVRPDAPDRPVLFGGLTWCAGVALALLVASLGAGGLLGVLGGSAAGVTAGAAERIDGERAVLAPEEEARAKQAAEDAAKAASAMAWTMLGALLTGLVATMLGASLFHREETTRKPETRIRPSPAQAS